MPLALAASLSGRDTPTRLHPGWRPVSWFSPAPHAAGHPQPAAPWNQAAWSTRLLLLEADGKGIRPCRLDGRPMAATHWMHSSRVHEDRSEPTKATLSPEETEFPPGSPAPI